MSTPGVDAALREIALVTDRELGQLDVDALLLEVLDRVVAALQADTAAVLLLDAAGGHLAARAAIGIEEEVRQGVRVPLGVGFAGTVAARRRPLHFDLVDPSTVWNPILWEKGIRRLLGVPLLAGSNLLGVLHVGRISDKGFTDDDAALLERVAERMAIAVSSRRAEIERAAGRLVQRSLLPPELPRVAGIDFAARYASAELDGLGGDWYDAFLLDDGNLWVMMGDVAGHGLEAAITMGRLRAALRSYALEGHGAAKVLTLTNRKAEVFDPDQMATVIVGLLEPPYDRVALASAGHPPPVFAAVDQPAALVDVPVCPPVGVTGTACEEVDVDLPPGGVLLLYTDGLVERRGEPLDAGLARLTSIVTADEPEQVCRRVMGTLVGSSRPTDDIAVIAMRRTA